MTKIISTILSFFVGLSLLAQSSILDRIKSINNTQVTKIETLDGYSSCYRIMFRQPINHSDTSEGFFYQKIYLSHKSIDKPMVLNVNGYVASSNIISDWTKSLNANQIYVEHRFFGQSIPQEKNYEHLNMSNSAKDLHRIKVAFSKIYGDAWISTGISKGGLTALSYKYFYPDDVKATIALSTSVKTSECDSSFFNFIDSLNSNQGCKDELYLFQRLLLKEKDNIIPYLEEYLISKDMGFDHLGLTSIYEIAVLEIPFSIWQNGNGCQTIDFSVTDPKSLFNEMRKSLNGWFMTDEVFNRIDSYHIQALTELGYYCYPVTRFSSLLESEFKKLTPVHPIKGVNITYSNELMIQIKEWAENNGNGVVYISGGNDPYSKYRIIPSEEVKSKSYLLEGKNHNEVYNYYIDSKKYDEIRSLIMNWIEQ